MYMRYPTVQLFKFQYPRNPLRPDFLSWTENRHRRGHPAQHGLRLQQEGDLEGHRDRPKPPDVATGAPEQHDALRVRPDCFHPFSPIQPAYSRVCLTDSTARIFTAIPLFFPSHTQLSQFMGKQALGE